MTKFDVIYTDCCWQYNTKECLAKTSVLDGKNNTHYETLTTSDLKCLPIKDICADDCILFHWVVSPMLQEGLDVMDAWGFKYCTIAFVWHKQRANPGHYTMSECEICLVGRRGKIPTPRGSRNVRQFLSSMREKHSKKPDEIRNRITKMFPTQNRLELFARQRTENWTAIGFDIDGKDIRDSIQELINAAANQ